jgi:tRNA G18 (ribose-2'-O)-methylase SpoU
MGNEVNGVSEDVMQSCDEVLEISQFGTKQSLNISVTAGIVVWEIWRQLNANQ